MNALFAYVLEMSLAGSIAALAVLVFRFLLRKAPKWILCALWALVAIRLLFPFSIQSPFSFTPPQKEAINVQIRESFVDEEKAGSFWASFDAMEEDVPEEREELQIETSVKEKPSVSVKDFLPFIWMIGVVAMLFSMSASYLRIKLKMASSIPFAEAVKLNERVRSPFILGLIRPVIYLPFGLDDWTMLSVLAHEKAHIRRGDHVIKPFAWLLLSVHWFNPLFWLSYALLCKDIEGACDEKVLADMNENERRDYARALLKCSTRSVGVYACPLAFGELNVKERIKMTLSYKKPVFWVIVLSLVIALIATVGILSDPLKGDEKEPSTSETEKMQAADFPREKRERADWWGGLSELKMMATGETTIYDFSYDQAVFQEKAINKNDKTWTDPVIVAESMEELTDILDGCVKDGEQNKYMLEAVEYYFKLKADEYNKIYPASKAPDFFDNHVIMLVYARPQETCWYVSGAMLKETEEGALQVILNIANFFPYDGIMEGNESLLFYWISREAWDKYKNGKIEFNATMDYQPEWLRYENYLYENKDSGETYHLILRKNTYDEVPLACSVYFGKTYLTRSRTRFLDFYKKAGYEDDSILRGQAENCTFYYPATKEDGVLTVNQCGYKQSENADILATHIFKIKDGKLIYDADASPDKISGLPDGAVFTLKEFKN